MGPEEDVTSLPAAGCLALAALLPKQDGKPLTFRCLQDVADAADVRAIRDFEVAGRKCLQQLSKDALDAVANLPKPVCPKSKYEAQEPSLSDGERDQILTLLTRHDGDGDGYLNRDELRAVFEQLDATQHLSEGAADDVLTMLLGSEAANGNGLLQVSAFMDWLSGHMKDSDPTAEETEESAYGAPQESGGQDQVPSKELGGLKDEVERLAAELAKATADKEKALKKQELAEDQRLITEKLLAKRDREVEALEKRLKKLERDLEASEQRHEQELESCHDFWRSVAKSSARCTLDQIVDLSGAKWLGNGKYGYVLRTHRREDEREVVVKLLSLRWAHLALKEWHCSHLLAGHEHTVAFEEPMLHADDDKVIEELLKAGFEEGVLTAKTKRTSFPDRWICLVEEFMNRGTVQDWMDKGLLTLGGMIVVMQSVAAALAHMHSCGLTHNDIKPENVLLAQDDKTGPQGEVLVKLADLGLAKLSSDRNADFSQFGMTVVCMATGEKFGSRKFQPEDVDTYVADVEGVVRTSVATMADTSKNKALQGALPHLPKLLRKIFKSEVTMQEVRDWPSLQGAGFFDSLEPASVETMERASVGRSLSGIGD
mmetsp:Transcript_73034/g.136426  ORF Transcript_73034/g.136426 Transcript_73034/m.136426 type:complete len:600 (-) Transcript_73034:20-1819(-)